MGNMLSKFSFFPCHCESNTLFYIWAASSEVSQLLSKNIRWSAGTNLGPGSPPVQGHRCAVWTPGPIWPSPLWLRSALHLPHQNRKWGDYISWQYRRKWKHHWQQQNHKSIHQTKRCSANDERNPKKTSVDSFRKTLVCVSIAFLTSPGPVSPHRDLSQSNPDEKIK